MRETILMIIRFVIFILISNKSKTKFYLFKTKNQYFFKLDMYSSSRCALKDSMPRIRLKPLVGLFQQSMLISQNVSNEHISQHCDIDSLSKNLSLLK